MFLLAANVRPYFIIPAGYTKEPLYYATYPSSAGIVLLVGTIDAIAGLHFVTATIEEHLGIFHKKLGQYPIHNEVVMAQHWQKIIQQERYTLALYGTPFQRKVWQGLTKIPIGLSISYQSFARQLQIPESTRAVANAIASNNIAYLIPCHRVVRTDGSLGGYRWGLAVKKQLLMMEAAQSGENIFQE